MRLNKHAGTHFGKAAYGLASVSIHGATPAPLVGKTAGMLYGPPWLDGSNVIYQNCSDGPCRVQSINVGTLALTARDPGGASQLTAGGGEWQAFLASTPSMVRTSTGLSYPAMAVLDAAIDGRYVLCDDYQAGAGITVYSPIGAILYELPGVQLFGGSAVKLSGDILAYRDAVGWHLVNIATGETPLWFARTDPDVGIVIPIQLGDGSIVVVERSEFLTIRNANSASGFTVEASPIAFSPDAMELSAGVFRVGYCTNEGESTDSLTLVDVTLATGAQSIGVVSGGTVAFSAGPTLTPEEFPVGPEGSSLRVVQLEGHTVDVCQHPEGWALVYVNGYTVTCLVNGIMRWTFTIVPPPDMDGKPLYMRIACDPLGNVTASCTISHTNNWDMVYLLSAAGITALGLRGKTQHSTLITYEGSTFVVYITDTPKSHIRYPLDGVPGAPILMPFASFVPPKTNPMGFLDIVDGVITWACDDDAEGYHIVEYAGVLFYQPNIRGGVTVGQAQGEPTTPEGILAYHKAGISTVMQGKGFDPHLAQVITGPDAGSYVFCANFLHNVIQYAVMKTSGFPGYDGNLFAATIPPVAHPVEENGQTARQQKWLEPGSTRMTLPWQGWCQAVREALTNLASAITGLQQAVGEGLGFGKIAVDDPAADVVSADQPNDTVTFTSEDASVVITTNANRKTVDFAAVGGGGGTGPGNGYWTPLTDGDLTQAELIFADGDAIMCWMPTP